MPEQIHGGDPVGFTPITLLTGFVGDIQHHTRLGFCEEVDGPMQQSEVQSRNLTIHIENVPNKGAAAVRVWPSITGTQDNRLGIALFQMTAPPLVTTRQSATATVVEVTVWFVFDVKDPALGPAEIHQWFFAVETAG